MKIYVNLWLKSFLSISLRCIIHTISANIDVDIPFGIANYRLIVHRHPSNETITQVVIYVRKTTSGLAYHYILSLEKTTYELNIIRL